jgi:CPA2 family monovalent cation:H+ antiporter-2
MHDLPLISTIAAAFTAAWVLGLITQHLKLSPTVGYLLAGVIIGPYTPGFVGDAHVAHQLAELGVILLMFGVGLHFHLRDLMAVKGVAIPGALGQSLFATVLAVAVFGIFGMPSQQGAVLGMAMAVASTVVLMRVLMDANSLHSVEGHIAVGWLIVEDILTVILLVMIPILGGDANSHDAASTIAEPSIWYSFGLAITKLVALIAIVVLAGSRLVPWTLLQVARLRSRELFTLTVLVFSIAIAAGSAYFFGASMALGAFLAGMVVAQSSVSHQAAAEALPLRDAFAVLFFVSVGMIFDPAFLVQEPLMILAALGIILLGKPVAAIAIVALLGHSARTALTVGVGLAQIGEFSFILSELARQHGLMPEAGHNVLVAAAIISITLNPFLFRKIPQIELWLKSRPTLWKLLNGRAERRATKENADTAKALRDVGEESQRRAIVIGYGPVGRSVHHLLRDAGLRTVIIDLNMDTISSLKSEGVDALYGDASHESILEQAGIKQASHLAVTLPHSSDRLAVVATARTLNPTLRILVRAHYMREREDLEQAGANAAVFEEAEAAVALARLVLTDTGEEREEAERRIKDLRHRLILENISNIRTQRVRSVMVPWSRVSWLSTSATTTDVLQKISRERFSRWPVIDSERGRANGYLLAKDLIAQADNPDWKSHIRQLKSVTPSDRIEPVLARMQTEHDSIYLVTDRERPVGLITLEDILEQVVGQIEDEYPHEDAGILRDAISAGGYDFDVRATGWEEAIRELVDIIPSDHVPLDVTKAQIASLCIAREEEVSTTLGEGIAIPHARVAGLSKPLAVFGRSRAGVAFTSTAEPVYLMFLLVTPVDRPEMQLTLLAQLAAIARDTVSREQLKDANSAAQVLSILSK